MPMALSRGKMDERQMIKTSISRPIFSQISSALFPALSLGIFSAVWMAAFAAILSSNSAAQTGAWLTHSHDEQHTALSTVQSQPLNSIHWHMPVDLHPPQGEIFIHYGSPLVTAANTGDRSGKDRR